MDMYPQETESEPTNGNGNGHGAEPADTEPEVLEATATGGEAEPDPTDADTDHARLASVIESLLVAAGAPVPLGKLVDALHGPDRREVLAALDTLATRLESDARGVRLVQVAGAYQLRTPPEHGPWVRRLLGTRPPRLSRPMLETLAIVAYRQPCTRVEVEAVRGVDADATLSTLLERRLVKITGRKETPGRPLLYGTTRDFLEVFGLPDLGALPPLRDLGDNADLILEADLTVAPEGVTPTPVDEEAVPPALDAEPEPPGDGA
jgi:segregation and condensation protein B